MHRVGGRKERTAPEAASEATSNGEPPESKWIRMLIITTVRMVLMGLVRFMVLARIMITVAMKQMVRHNHYGEDDHRQHDDDGSDDSTTMMMNMLTAKKTAKLAEGGEASGRKLGGDKRVKELSTAYICPKMLVLVLVPRVSLDQ